MAVVAEMIWTPEIVTLTLFASAVSACARMIGRKADPFCRTAAFWSAEVSPSKKVCQFERISASIAALDCGLGDVFDEELPEDGPRGEVPVDPLLPEQPAITVTAATSMSPIGREVTG